MCVLCGVFGVFFGCVNYLVVLGGLCFVLLFVSGFFRGSLWMSSSRLIVFIIFWLAVLSALTSSVFRFSWDTLVESSRWRVVHSLRMWFCVSSVSPQALHFSLSGLFWYFPL